MGLWEQINKKNEKKRKAGGLLRGEVLGGSKEVLIDASLTAHPLSSGKRALAQMRHGYQC